VQNTVNGNGAARPLVRGASLVHRTKLSQGQRAVLVADIDDGVAKYQPTQSELAKAIGVSLGMVQRAKRLSPLARQRVMSGEVTVGHYTPKVIKLDPPAVKILDATAIEDEMLRAVCRKRVTDYVLSIAAEVEKATQ